MRSASRGCWRRPHGVAKTRGTGWRIAGGIRWRNRVEQGGENPWNPHAKTGKLRKTALMRVEHQGVYAVVASLGGAPKNPVWYYNLKKNPHVELQDRATKRDYLAREVSGDEKAIWWVGAGGRSLARLRDLLGEDRPPDPGVRARADGVGRGSCALRAGCRSQLGQCLPLPHPTNWTWRPWAIQHGQAARVLGIGGYGRGGRSHDGPLLCVSLRSRPSGRARTRNSGTSRLPGRG